MGNHEGYVVLIKKPNDPQLYGPVECSFSLDVRPNETQYFWSSEKAYSNLGTGPIKVDGLKDAKYTIGCWKPKHSDWEFKIWDLKDPMLPITIDWALYEDAIQPAKTFSGRKDKYHGRNLSFAVKSGHDFAASVAEATSDQTK